MYFFRKGDTIIFRVVVLVVIVRGGGRGIGI